MIERRKVRACVADGIVTVVRSSNKVLYVIDLVYKEVEC